jgi:O-antigen ligase
MRRYASWAFIALFFFLPLSKPLTYASILVSVALLTALLAREAPVRLGPSLPLSQYGWLAPAGVLAALPVMSWLVHDPVDAAGHWSIGTYWALSLLTFLAARSLSIVPWLNAFLAGTLLAWMVQLLHWNGHVALGSLPPAFGNTIQASQYLSLALVVCSLLARHSTDPRHWFAYLVAGAVFLAGVATGVGRTGMLTVLILSPLIAANYFPRQSAWVRNAAIAAIAVALLASPDVQLRIAAAFSDLQRWQSGDPNTSLGYRFQMWGIAADLYRQAPWTGNGAGSFGRTWALLMPGEERFVDPHNAYLFHAASYGTIGLVALVVLYVALLWTGWTHRGTLAGGMTLAIALILILGSITNTNFVNMSIRTMLVLFVGLQGHLLREAWERHRALARQSPQSAPHDPDGRTVRP